MDARCFGSFRNQRGKSGGITIQWELEGNRVVPTRKRAYGARVSPRQSRIAIIAEDTKTEYIQTKTVRSGGSIDQIEYNKNSIFAGSTEILVIIKIGSNG